MVEAIEQMRRSVVVVHFQPGGLFAAVERAFFPALRPDLPQTASDLPETPAHQGSS